MKFRDFKEEAAGVGIVTKQNATKDVPVGGEYANVKKLGLGKGKPKEHSKKTKGSKTNVLFNLGMAEEEYKPHMMYKGTKKDYKAKFPTKKKHHDRLNKAGYSHDDPETKKKEEGIIEVSAKDLIKGSEIYVDMDGVLADFFGAWKKLVGKDWREITDLDDALQKIRDKDDFWLNIPVTSNANNLLSLIKQLKGKYNILSAPLPNDPNSEPHKREWIKKNLSSFPPSNVIITSNKAVHATQPDGTPNILIDDFGKNIAKWEAAGGVGFKHKDHKFERTVKNLKQYMDQDAKEGIANMAKGAVSNIKNAATAGKLILKYHQTGLEQDAFAAIKHGWQWIKNPTMRSKIVNLVKKYAEKEGEDWPTAVAHIKKNTGIDVSKVNEADMSKASIKKIHKTADKIKDKPKAKKSIGKWAKERGMDPEGAIYAIATNMRKRKEGKKIDAPGRESANEGNLLANPQRSVLVKRDDAYDWYKIGTHMANIKNMPPDVQKKNKPDIFIQFYGGEKEKKYMMKNLKRIGYSVQDADGYKDSHFDENIEGSYVLRIGLDRRRLHNESLMYVTATKMAIEAMKSGLYTKDEVLGLLENFADGKVKGKSRPGRVKKAGASCGGSVTELRKKAKNASGERAKMYHWCANMKGGRKKKGK